MDNRKDLKKKLGKFKPKFVISISEWMKNNDPSALESWGTDGLRSIYFYLLAPQLGVYVDVSDFVVGFNAKKATNCVFKMDIYTENENFVRDIVRIINDRFQTPRRGTFPSEWVVGILPNLNFEKLEKKFNVGKDDITNAWKSFLQ